MQRSKFIEKICFQGYYYKYWYRKKRSLAEENSTDSTSNPAPVAKDQNSTDTRVYEFYEAYMPHQPHILMTDAQFKSNFTVLPPRTNIPRRRKPKRPVTTNPPKEAAEASDLADDKFFFDQLEKRRPPKQDSDEIEMLQPKNPKPRKEVGFVHKDDRKKNEKQNDYETYEDVNEEKVYTDYTDQQGDYGIDNDQDEIMNDHSSTEANYENFRMKEQHLHKDGTRTVNEGGTTVICKDHIIHTHQEADVPSVAEQKPQEVPSRRHRLKRKRNETKKFGTPEQLYAEIERILEQKRKNHSKKDDFYELRIQPLKHY